jgi:hypothetical protein
VLSATNAQGAEIRTGTVTLDGKPVEDALGGRAISADPGPHEIEVRASDLSLHDSIVLREYEKGRRVILAAKRTALPRPPQESEGGIPTSSWVLGGIGVAAIVPATIFGVMGVNQRSEQKCDVGCVGEFANGVRTKFLLADVFIGVSIVGIGAAAILWALHGSGSRARSAVFTGQF